MNYDLKCAEPGCTEEAVVGLQGVQLCLDCFSKRFDLHKERLKALTEDRKRRAAEREAGR